MMKKLFVSLFIPFYFASVALSQQAVKAIEMTDPHFSTPAWATQRNKPSGFGLSWGSTDVRYAKGELPNPSTTSKITLSAWRGETVNLQAVVWNTTDTESPCEVQLSDMKAPKGKVIKNQQAQIGFVGYVMTDGLFRNCGCGLPAGFENRDSSLVADIIHHPSSLILEPYVSRPIWISIDVPSDAATSTYKGKLYVTVGSRKKAIDIELQIIDRTLPSASQWKYHLDLWQNPYSVARYYDVRPWSKEHLELMAPIMSQLARAGQKVITVPINHKPWGGQTYDFYETMILRTKELDGSWSYNFDIFDRWVSFMMSQGIDKQISCYSVAPWQESYQYFDIATNSLQYVKAKVGEPAYEAYWTPFLKAFSKHLNEKGWLEKTVIAMDERPLDMMRSVIEYLHRVAPEFKIALAGNHHPEIQEHLYDYCVALRNRYDASTKKERNDRKQVTTFYTCCSEGMPNTFTFSQPSEARWLSWHAAAEGYDGYLRWAYNSWNPTPLLDSRYSQFSGGDCFFIYPESRSSIRFEKLREGIQDFEKIAILKAHYKETNNTIALQQLNDALLPFTNVEVLYEQGATKMLQSVTNLLNK